MKFKKTKPTTIQRKEGNLLLSSTSPGAPSRRIRIYMIPGYAGGPQKRTMEMAKVKAAERFENRILFFIFFIFDFR